MRAVVLTEPGRVEVVEGWPDPQCGPDDVVVEMRGVGLCGTDLAMVDGKAAPPQFPWVIGHEGGGVIAAVGERVTDRKVGDRVVIEPNFGCGTCAVCAAGHTSRCDARLSAGFNVPGLLSELVAVPAEYTWVVPESISDVQLACLEPLAVAHHAVLRSGVRAGQECLVIGAGSVGQLISQCVLAVGGVPVVTDPHPGRLEVATSLGARVEEGPRAGRYPHVFETSGVGAVWPGALEAAARGGVITLIGFMRDTVELTPVELVRRQITVRGHLIYDHPADFAATIETVAEGRLVPEQAVQATFAAEDAVAAFAAVRQVPGKTWIRW
ncbi:zinc-dependent alcohol dehydrogenase [Georgenia thermotolerans]|uniref:Alcohol dehydrogenase catalytic domain-containing protein n=1 Tax=Georgenia thermotolerans TaxID=527326 RepID=A0A7J5UUF9_9MICO|nr:alcohol dehydrogenase catalytic domain-containing protein [Georgenia thermotolerans]KAE8765924.1 alcohol dehydrogenase catalytic domain-containing protein [Georgenia thermotolerans]